MNDVLVNVSYCQAHRKHMAGAVAELPGQLHAEWLEKCVNHLLASGLPVIVSATGWPGLCNVEISPLSVERVVLWRVFNKVRFMTMPDAGHQLGAAWNVRQGLEFALTNHYPYMIHTAEDVVVTHKALHDIADALRRGSEYVGGDWTPGLEELNTQHFGCKVEPLMHRLDPARLAGGGQLEKYFYDLLRDRPKLLWEGDRPYGTTHYYDEWLAGMRAIGAEV